LDDRGKDFVELLTSHATLFLGVILAEFVLAEMDEHRIGAITDRSVGLGSTKRHFAGSSRAGQFSRETPLKRVVAATEDVCDLSIGATESAQFEDLLGIDRLAPSTHTLRPPLRHMLIRPVQDTNDKARHERVIDDRLEEPDRILGATFHEV
jgi:hypothetical protein